MLMCKTIINHSQNSLRSRESTRAEVIKRLYLRQELVESETCKNKNYG